MYKILILSYYFPPTGGGGVQRILSFLEHIPENKYDVHVITARDPGLTIADNTLINDKNLNITIHRVGKFKNFSATKTNVLFETAYWKRILSSLLFFPDSRSAWEADVTRYLKENKQILYKAQLIITTVPPFTSAIIARRISEFTNIPFIIDYRDGWIYNPFQLFPLPGYKWRHKIMEKRILAAAQGVIFVNKSLENKYHQMYKSQLSSKSVITIHNGFNQIENMVKNTPEVNDDDIVHVGIPGTIYFRGNRPIALLHYLKRNKPLNLKFHLIGKQTKAFRTKLKKMGLTHYFVVHDYMNHKQYLNFLNKMAFNVLFIEKKVPNVDVWIPGRFYELLAHPVPLAVIGPEPHEMREIILQVYGHNYYYTSVELMFENILQHINNLPEKKVNNEFLQTFDRKKLAQKFWGFVEKIITKDSPETGLSE